MATIYETLRLLSAYGWRQSGRVGNVRILVHPARPGVRIILAGALNKPLHDSTLREILDRAGLDEDLR